MAQSTTERPFKPGRRIDIPLLPNLRDIGGYATASGGRVRSGQLFRSTELNHLAGEDLERFAELGIRTVFDLRTEPERTAEPDLTDPLHHRHQGHVGDANRADQEGHTAKQQEQREIERLHEEPEDFGDVEEHACRPRQACPTTTSPAGSGRRPAR